MQWIPLILIPALYFLLAIAKPHIQPRLPFNLCAICVSVSVTWVILAGFWLLNFSVSPLVLGVLIGMSVCGFMYKAEDFYKKSAIRNFWFVRMVVVVCGLYGAYFFLEKKWELLIFTAIASFFLMVIATVFFQGTTHAEAMQEVKEKRGIIEKLDNCC